MTATLPRLSSLISEHDGSADERYAVIGAIDNDSGTAPGWQSARTAITPGDLPGTLRVDVAWVRPAADDDLDNLSTLLARLRDVHARRVVVLADAIDCDATFFTGLGFEARKSPSSDGLLFVWDPDLANQPRSWNNADSWANPENFSRFRW